MLHFKVTARALISLKANDLAASHNFLYLSSLSLKSLQSLTFWLQNKMDFSSFSQLHAHNTTWHFIAHIIEPLRLCPANKINTERERERAIFQIYSPLYTFCLSLSFFLSDAAQTEQPGFHFCLDLKPERH